MRARTAVLPGLLVLLALGCSSEPAHDAGPDLRPPADVPAIDTHGGPDVSGMDVRPPTDTPADAPNDLARDVCYSLWDAGPDARAAVSIGDSPTRGPVDAPVLMVEYGDFECGFCGLAEPTIVRLLAAYPTQIRFVFKHFAWPFHPHAHLASEAAMAAHAQGRFWPYHDILYTHQSALERADLETYAMMTGLDLPRFRAALDNHTYLAAVDADFAQGQALGVGGTPAFFINGRLIEGARSYEEFVNEIEAELHPCH